jgi:regulatory protein
MDNPYYEKLVNASLRFVSYRPRSEKEFTDFLTKKLIRWKVSGCVLIQKVILRMQELGYIDDRKFVSWWVEQRSLFRPKGKRLIKLELLQKGIDRELIQEISTNELEGAQKAIRRKLVLWSRMPITEQKKKVYTFLAQRGFSSGTIGSIIDGIGKKDYN